MTIKESILTGAVYTPWPVSIDGINWPGARFNFYSLCTDDCKRGSGRFRCKHGLTYSQHQIGNEQLTVCGYIDDIRSFPIEQRDKFSKRIVREAHVFEWIEKIKKLKAVFSTPKTSDSNPLGALHEINRWASQINTIAQRMVMKNKEDDFSSNFDAASRDMKSLYKASTMLVDAFDFLNIYYNPSSAAFGKKRSVELYKIVDKIKIILMEAEGAAQNKKITINGPLHRYFDLYESFKIIPFCILQNAIKYSFENEITIGFVTNSRDVDLSIESSGPQITDEEKTRIFEKGYRGARSREMHHEGLGIGLYIAKIVADAHDLEIKVRSTPKNYQRSGIPVFQNTFSIKFSLDSNFQRPRR
ncbi:sensor histidine kinase [Herbaspirillum seropedicae]|uniref:sensor histidine kinase n=1 Tax=Herbaspirillum seropedicae TaxID=964 RepID=UPI0015DE3373|nr:sensor histidine kinase [Herbaspirillum seropedicae]